MRSLTIISNLKKSNKRIKKHRLTLRKIKSIYGVGNATVKSYAKKFGLNNCFVKKIKIKVLRLMDKISFKLTWDKNLMNKLIANRKFLMQNVKNYRSLRHSLRYPARGQRTKTNSSTRKKIKGETVQYLT